MVLLYGEFIFWVRLWGKKIYQRDKILTDYGLELSSLNGVDFCQGLSLGVLSIILLFGVQGLLGWILWQPPKAFIVQIVLEGLLVAGGIGFAEELLFRGWLWGIFINAGLFDLHYFRDFQYFVGIGRFFDIPLSFDCLLLSFIASFFALFDVF